MANNEIAKIESLGAEVGSVRTTVDMSTQEGKLLVYSALQDSENLRDHINETIALTDIIQERTEFANEETGEIEQHVRTTLINDKGKAFHATSDPLAASVQRLFGIFGNPRTWAEPLKVMAVEKKSNANGIYRYIQLVPVIEKSAK